MSDTSAQSGEFGELTKLQLKVNQTELPSELKQKVQTMIERAELSFKRYLRTVGQALFLQAITRTFFAKPWRSMCRTSLF